MKYRGAFIDALSGSDVERELSDDEVVETFMPQLIFSASADQVPADGVTTVTITLQLMSLPLSDDKRRVIRQARQVTIIEDGERAEIALDANGHAELIYSFEASGVYEFTTDASIAGVGVSIEAIEGVPDGE